MLGIVLIMSGIGTALISIIVVVFEWRAMVGYWRVKRRTRKSPNERELRSPYLAASGPDGQLGLFPTRFWLDRFGVTNRNGML
ncbi:hypothetical protein ACVWXL_004099 [Bradyrhizobium sp. GM22.5]